ncbi:MAG: PIN domain-containing protein [Coriobacteriia bacterium]|nr:PIN domain-containing protein [Coriobacteriia bacterium]
MAAKENLLVDTNIIIDYLGRREPFYADARLLLLAGKVGEFRLWISSSQVTDTLYILSEGGKKSLMPSVLQRMDKVLSFVRVCAATEEDVHELMHTLWSDPEDALLHQIACRIQASAIITRNQQDFAKSVIPVYDCARFFEAYALQHGISYAEVEF